MLAKLAEELQSRFGPTGAELDRDELARAAHAMVAMSGMLGFTALARLCSELDETSRSGGEYKPLLARLHRLKAEAIAEINVLRAA